MKTQKKKTLPEFLALVNKNRKKFGDMFVDKLRDQKGKMLVRFSEMDKRFLFSWDVQEKNWVLMK